MGNPWQAPLGQSAMSVWKDRQQRNLGIPESSTDRHNREWAEGLEKHPQVRDKEKTIEAYPHSSSQETCR